MSFLSDYLLFTSGNEAPDMFHVWSGYAALSAAVGRRVWITDGDDFIYTNIFVILVGDAGSGKSTAIRRAKRLLTELGDVPISRSVETPEGLCRFMAGDPNANPPVESPVATIVKWPDNQLRETHPMTIIANEFVNFISKDPVNWTGMLNDIYDDDKYEYRTKNKGEDLLIGPYIVLLGALTSDVSATLQKAGIVGTGFARRTIFQYGKRKYHEPHARQSFNADQAAAKRRCKEHLAGLKKFSGEVKLSSQTWEWWTEWYNEHTRTIPQRATPQTEGWYTSKPNQTLRIAILTSLSERSDLVVDITHLQVAIAYLAEMEKDLYHVLGSVGRNELAAVAQKIFEYVLALNEPIPRRALQAKFFNFCKPPNDFSDCMRYLIDSGKLKEEILTVGTTSDVVVSTPQVLAAFRASVSARASQPHFVAPPSIVQGSGDVAHPSSSPQSPATDLTVSPDLSEPPPVGETSTDQPQK